LSLDTRDAAAPATSDETDDRSASASERLPRQVSRRQFGREAAIAAAAGLGAPVLLASTAAAAGPAALPNQKPEPLKGLSPAQVADVDAKLANILRKYGDRFDAGQKAHLRRILAQNERLLAPVRAFHLENGDPPASVLRISFPTAGSPSEKSEG
jgi:hypothetical protein